MNSIMSIATTVPLLAAAGVIIYIFLHLPALTPSGSQDEIAEVQIKLTTDELGELEGTLQKLVRVLIVANKIEKPDGKLGTAVETNFRRGVSYLFLISNSKAVHEHQGYFQLFRAYEQIHTHTSGLLDIKALPFEWDDYPIIFYQVRDAGGNMASIAFRGSDLREGLATYYERVPSAYAHTIATTLLADAPKDIELAESLGRKEFDDGERIPVNNVVQITKRTA